MNIRKYNRSVTPRLGYKKTVASYFQVFSLSLISNHSLWRIHIFGTPIESPHTERMRPLATLMNLEADPPVLKCKDCYVDCHLDCNFIKHMDCNHPNKPLPESWPSENELMFVVLI